MELHTLILLGHIIGVGFGLGGATVSDVFFMRMLNNKKITKEDYQNLKVLSRIVWTGILVLILSGVGFLVRTYAETGEAPGLLESPRFQAKLTLVGIVTLNGLVFHFYVFRQLKNMIGKSRALEKKIWLFAITGAISATSWYSIVVIALLREVSLPYWGWMAGYFLALIGGITTARLVIARLLKSS